MNAVESKPFPKIAIVGIAVVGLLGLLVAILLVRNSNSSSIAQEKTVRLGSFSVAVDYAPYLIAKNKGWFEEAVKKDGYKVEYTTFQSLPPINEALATDRIDGLVAAEPPFIVGNSAGIKSQIVAISCSLVQEILVSASSEIDSPSKLRGKKIAVLAGTSSHHGLFKMLDAAGVKRTEVEIVDMIPPDAKAAFSTGQVDAWAVWPPFVEQEEISGTGRVLPKGDALVHSVMGMRSKFLEGNPEIARGIVAVLERAKKWIQENPDEAMAIVSQELDVPLEVVTRAWPRHDWMAVLSEEVKTDIQSKADFLFDEGFIKQRVKVADVVELAFTTEDLNVIEGVGSGRE